MGMTTKSTYRIERISGETKKVRSLYTREAVSENLVEQVKAEMRAEFPAGSSDFLRVTKN